MYEVTGTIRGENSHLIYREGMGHTVEIFDILVKDRRKGEGRRLVDKLYEMFPQYTIYAFTREENAIAHLFYESLGFYKVADLKSFYSDGNAAMYARIPNKGILE